MHISVCSQHAQKIVDRAENNGRFYIVHSLQLAQGLRVWILDPDAPGAESGFSMSYLGNLGQVT